MALPPNISVPLNRLSDMVHRRVITQVQIAQATGIHQAQISRILAGQIKRPSKNVQKLCSYAFSLSSETHRTGEAVRQRLIDAIIGAWDGTKQHADALENALAALDRTQRTFRAK